jgi:signal peptidase II
MVDGGSAGSSWGSRRAVVTLVVVTVLALAADLGSKWAAFRWVAGVPVHVERERVLELSGRGQSLAPLIPPHDAVTVVPLVLDLSLVLNRGAVFGIGAGKRWFFVAFTVMAIGFGLWMFGSWTRPGDRAAHVAIGLLLAGGLGNLYDRLVYASVRDFLHPLPGMVLPFGWRMPFDGGREVWPYVSNVADLWLLIGIGILMVQLWRGSPGQGSLRPRQDA